MEHKENQERMAIIARYMKAPKDLEKSSEKANLYRDEGNKLYKAKNYYEATVKYNMR